MKMGFARQNNSESDTEVEWVDFFAFFCLQFVRIDCSMGIHFCVKDKKQQKTDFVSNNQIADANTILITINDLDSNFIRTKTNVYCLSARFDLFITQIHFELVLEGTKYVNKFESILFF